jgi:hypothetical protein
MHGCLLQAQVFRVLLAGRATLMEAARGLLMRTVLA